jgi:uncharacterized delta-60 repeat protein
LRVEALEDRRMLAAGDLDLTFGVGGKVVQDLGLGKAEEIYASAIQADGKIVVGGLVNTPNGAGRDFLVARYDVNGSLDPSFGTGGYTIVDVSDPGSGSIPNFDDQINDIAIQSDGKIVAVGIGSKITGPGTTRFQGFAVVRLTATGQLDTSFDGDGKLVTVLQAPGNVNADANAVAIQADGKIVVGGTSVTSVTTRSDFAVARYNTDGSLDTSFNGIGYVITDFDSSASSTASDHLLDIAIQSDGRIVAVGDAFNNDVKLTGSQDAAIARYNTDGSLDTSFGGGDGKVLTDVVPSVFLSQDFVYSVALEPDGQIVIAGRSAVRITQFSSTNSDFVVYRYNADGTLDTSFAPASELAGTLRINFGTTDIGRGLTLQPQPDGKYVVGGYLGLSGATNDFGVARVLLNGQLDTSFSGDGKTQVHFANTDNTRLLDIRMQPDGKIVAVGFVITTGGNADIAMARFESGLLIAAAGGPYALDEPGGSVALAGSAIGEGTLTYLWDLDNDGIFGEAAGPGLYGDENGPTPTFSVSGVDGPAVYTVTLRVLSDVDNDMITDQISEDVTTVTVVNVAPIAVIANGGAVDEGSPGSVSFSGQFDPSPADTTAGFRYSYDFDNDGAWEIGDGSYGGSVVADSQIVPASFLADGLASYTIKARILDDDGGFTDYTTVITVNDVTPTLAISGAANVDEGAVYTLGLSSSDPGDDTITSWTIDWGDGIEVVAGNPASVTHTYADGANSYTVSATATDEDGTYSSNSISVTVDNVAPTLVISGAANVDEGTVFTLNLASSDPGTDTITSWSIDWGDSVEIVAGNPAGVTHTYADGANSYTVNATATDEDGTFASNSIVVAVDNVAPTLAISGSASVDEGSVYTLSLSSSDPGDDTIASWTIDWGDAIEIVAGSPASVTHTYADGANSYTISATATDEDGTYSSNSVSLAVANVAPTLVISGSANADEGAVYTLGLSSTDPGDDTIASWTIDWGDGIEIVAGNPASVTHNYADGPNSYTVSATATDEDGTFASNSIFVAVDNVAPTLVISGSASVDEGGLYTLGLSSSDPGDDTITSWTIDWGDSIEVVAGNPSSATHTYADGTANYTISATATDEDGTFNSNSLSVAVANVAPTLTISGAASVAEGGLYTLNLSSSDPGADTITGWTIDWGDAIEVVAGNPSSATHTYVDGTVSYTVIATATDEDGTFSSNSISVTVDNVAPTLVISGTASTDEGAVYTLTLSSSDPGADTIASWTIDWGDSVEVVAGNPGSVTHTFADGTVSYAVSATATDEDGTFSSNSITVAVNNVDPTADTGGPYTVDEGGTITLLGSGTDPAGAADPLTFEWDLDDNGSFETSGASPVFSAVGLDGPTSRTIHLRVSDGDGGVTVATTTVSVVNVAPTADAGGPYLTFDDTPITLSGSGSDPAGALDPLTFAWDLDNDGIFGETGAGATRGDETGANPTFDPTGLATGSYDVTLRVSDGDGGVTDNTATVNVLTVGTLLIDGTLYVVGSDSNDIVLFSKGSTTISVNASFNDNNPVTFNSADVTDVQVRVRGGHDIVLTTSNITQTMTIDGGSGNDLLTGGGGRNVLFGGSGHDFLYGDGGDDVLFGGTGNDFLSGGSGDDVLVGGDGDDFLIGGAGRDLIIGSQDNDFLLGGNGEDILIGGYTIHDNDLAALDAIMAIWSSSASFDSRVNALTTTGGLLQGGVAVFDDDDGDILVGGSGRDLIFGDTYRWDGAIDLIALQRSQDVLVAVN